MPKSEARDVAALGSLLAFAVRTAVQTQTGAQSVPADSPQILPTAPKEAHR